MKKQNSFDASCNDFDTFVEKLSHLVPDENKANSLITLLDFMVNGCDSRCLDVSMHKFLASYGYKISLESNYVLVERKEEHA